MDALIPISEHDGRRAVSGRDLHAFLEVGAEFAKWFARMTEYGFEYGEDFSSIPTKSTGGRPSTDYALTLDMAKELAMIQRTDRGKQARQYFIEVEKRARAIAVPQTYAEALEAAAAQARRAEQLEATVAELEPVAAHAETFRQAEGLRTIADVANDFKAHCAERFPGVKVRHQDVYDHAGRMGIIIRGESVRHNQPTAKAIEAGWARAHRTTYGTNTRGTQTAVSTRLTPRGEARLWDGLAAWLGAHGALNISH